MLVSYKWLKELVDVDVTTHELSEKMSTTGIEVEGVSSPSDGLTKLVVGHVVSCEDVPDTHLHLCQVDTGDDELRQIVCGAPNVTAGINVIVAVPGARIADNSIISSSKSRYGKMLSPGFDLQSACGGKYNGKTKPTMVAKPFDECWYSPNQQCG